MFKFYNKQEFIHHTHTHILFIHSDTTYRHGNKNCTYGQLKRKNTSQGSRRSVDLYIHTYVLGSVYYNLIYTNQEASLRL